MRLVHARNARFGIHTAQLEEAMIAKKGFSVALAAIMTLALSPIGALAETSDGSAAGKGGRYVRSCSCVGSGIRADSKLSR